MMTITEKIEMYKGKAAFVRDVSKAFEARSHKTGVERVEYEVYSKVFSGDTEENTCFAEYLVVTFVGGGKSVRSANGNSNIANFREIGKLIEGGYYDEVRDYEIMLTRDFVKVEV